jgi:5-methylthioadenosine/S-adenosylhomocysteine deaminase
MNGARCAGLDGKIGSLTPGKKADLILLRLDENPRTLTDETLSAILQGAQRSDVDTVIVNGVPRKRNGKLLSVDIKKVLWLADHSLDHLVDASTRFHESQLGQSTSVSA